MTRKEITASLLEAVTYYYVKKLYSVHPEFGIERWGRRRLDALCMNFKCEFIGIEIKSCLSDLREDAGKWRCYIPYVNKMYFCFPPSVVQSRKFPEIQAELKAEGVGILALEDGKIRCIQRAKSRDVSEETKHKMLIKMVWRTGTTRRTIKRTKKVHL